MSVKVRIHPLLLDLTRGEQMIETEGENVGECLNSLRAHFPGISQLLDKLGEAGLIAIFLNDLSIYADELDHPVRDGDELAIGVIPLGG